MLSYSNEHIHWTLWSLVRHFESEPSKLGHILNTWTLRESLKFRLLLIIFIPLRNIQIMKLLWGRLYEKWVNLWGRGLKSWLWSLKMKWPIFDCSNSKTLSRCKKNPLSLHIYWIKKVYGISSDFLENSTTVTTLVHLPLLFSQW